MNLHATSSQGPQKQIPPLAGSTWKTVSLQLTLLPALLLCVTSAFQDRTICPDALYGNYWVALRNTSKWNTLPRSVRLVLRFPTDTARPSPECHRQGPGYDLHMAHIAHLVTPQHVISLLLPPSLRPCQLVCSVYSAHVPSQVCASVCTGDCFPASAWRLQSCF